MIIMQSDRNENRTIVEQAEEIMSINIPFPASSNTSKYLQVKSQNDRKNYIRDKKSEFSKKSNSKSPRTQRIQGNPDNFAERVSQAAGALDSSKGDIFEKS